MIASRTGKRSPGRSLTRSGDRSRPDRMERVVLAILLVIGAVIVAIALWSVAAFFGLAGFEDPLELMHHLFP